MREEYYLLKLNNARYMSDNEEYNGCLKIIPNKALNGKIKDFDNPFFMIATKEENYFLDIISGKKIRFDDTIMSRGNFFVENTENEKISEEKEYEYLEKINNIEDDTLSIFDAEALNILKCYDEELTCFDYRKLSKEEAIREIIKLEDPLVVRKYMNELKSIISGEIAKKNAIMYLKFRKKMIEKKSISDSVLEMKKTRIFRQKYIRSKII